MLESVLPILAPLFAVGFLITGIRALIFATKNKDQLAGTNVIEKSLWWFKLFQKDGFGPQAEPQRKSISMWLIIFGTLFFIGGGLMFFLGAEAAKLK